MKNKPKIAVIGLKGLPAFGGAAAVGENIIENLKNEYNFTVLSVSSHTAKKTGNLNGYYQKVFGKIPLRRINTLIYYIRSAIYVLLHDFDLVHLHHRDAAFLTILLKWKQPVILTTHGIFSINDEWKKYHFYFKIQEKLFVKRATYITCVSQNEKRLFKKNLNLDVHYIPNGINPITIELGGKINDKKTILFAAGRIIFLKGSDILLKALKEISFDGKVIIVGNLDIDTKLKNEILSMAVGLNCEFTGLIKERHILNSFIRNADVFVFPSRRETMSMMLLEVAALKTPLIASDIIQNKDVFSEDELLYFKSEDVSDLSEKIKWALSHLDEMTKKSDRAYSKLMNQYSWQNIAQEYSRVYQRFLK